MNTSGYLLDPDVVYLNHGAFGATPEAVFHVYQEWQRVLERNPMEFFLRKLEPRLEEARQALSGFVGAAPERLAFVENATTAVNQVAWSLQLGPGDEVLLNDHEYGAVQYTWRVLAERLGFSVRTAVLPFPVPEPSAVLECLQSAASAATRCVCVSHITSPSALLFPVAEICAWARSQGILSLVDGAHAPGHIPLNLAELDADFYAGNLHKWACAPKAAAFLYARDPGLIRPLVVSWGIERNDWRAWVEAQGTRDLAAFLSVPEALRFWRERVGYGSFSAMAGRARAALAEAVGLGTVGYWSGLQMAAIRMPDSTDPVQFQAALWRDHRIEVPLFRIAPHVMLRISANAYNQDSDYEVLRRALV